MAWTTDLVLMTRALIGDISTPQTYVDEYIQRVLITAAYQVDAEFVFDYAYVYDIGAVTIVPDPVTNSDFTFIALIPLKAACILNQGEYRAALGQGIKVRDGDSAIDTSVSFKGYRDILELGPCAAYEKLRWSLLASNGVGGSGVGKAVLGPYREYNGNALTTISWYYDRLVTNIVSRSNR